MRNIWDWRPVDLEKQCVAGHLQLMHASRYEQPCADEADLRIEEPQARQPAFVDWLSRKWTPVVDFLGATKPLNLIAGVCGIIGVATTIAHAWP